MSIKQAIPKDWQSVRAWIKVRKFKGFGLLLFYCHMLMLFAWLAGHFLPGVQEMEALLEASSTMIAVQDTESLVTGTGESVATSLAAGAFELNALAGLTLLGKISSSLIWVMFGLTTLSLAWRICFKTALWLGLAHALFALLLLARASLEIFALPEEYLTALPEQLRFFAAGGCFYWLAGVLGLLALLGVTAKTAKVEQLAGTRNN